MMEALSERDISVLSSTAELKARGFLDTTCDINERCKETRLLRRLILDAEERIGKRLVTKSGSEFKIVQYLGGGGQGAVFLGIDELARKQVALKVLWASNDPVQRLLFERECQSLSWLDHPNIVKMSEFGETQDDELYMCMEFVKGRSLEDLIKEEGKLCVGDALEVCLQVADAMQYAHARGIVHGDLKPSNILVLDSGGELTVQVLDFGISNCFCIARERGCVYASLNYMSPEQLYGEGVDGRTDIYQLGLLLYECLFGRLPFRLTYRDAVEFRLLPEKSFRIGAKNPEARHPKECQLIRSCLEPNLKLRCECMQDLVSDLRGLLAFAGGKRQNFAVGT